MKIGFRLLTISVLLAITFGCKKSPTEPKDDNPRNDQAIVDLYYQWAAMSGNHNASGMQSLVASASNFQGMTNVCQTQWNSGSEMYYVFNSVTVHFWEADGTPYVVGNSSLYQGPGAPPIYTGFASSCRLQNGTWKLDGMNDNKLPNWWK
jgi:hypothetical protein